MSIVDISNIRPERDEALEKRLTEEVQRLDSLLFVRWLPVAYIGPHGIEGRYALMCRWPQNDKRWSWVQSGRHDPQEACDKYGWLCEDVQNAASPPATPEAMTRLVISILDRCNPQQFPATARMSQIIEKNNRVRQAQKNEVLDETHELASDQYYHSHRATRSFGGLPKEA